MHIHCWTQSLLRKDQKWCQGCHSWLFKGVVINEENYIKVASVFIRRTN